MVKLINWPMNWPWKKPIGPEWQATREIHGVSDTPDELSARSTDEVLHELHVHQIELETQNEELRRAQAALENAHNRYRDLYDFAPVGYLTLTRDGLIAEINRAGATLLGEAPRQLINRRFARYIAPEDGDRWHLYFTRLIRSGGRKRIEFTLQTRSGARLGIQFDGVREAATDEAAMVRATLTDVTARKQAEAELRIAAAAFESREAIFVTDDRKSILRVNRAFVEITGYAANEAIGQTSSLLHTGRQGTAIYDGKWNTVRRDGGWRGELWYRRKSGEEYPVSLTLNSVKGGDGKVTQYVGIFSDISERRTAEESIEQLAFYDPLTHLPNRRLMRDRLQQVLAAGVRSKRKGALMFIDLDNFKALNDVHGHDQGDLLLQQVALRLAACVRQADTVARLGGDEFVVMLIDLSANAAAAAAQAKIASEHVLGALNHSWTLGGHSYHSTASVGVTLFGGDNKTVDELLKQADLAMYQSKAAGGNTLRFFDAQVQATVTARTHLEAELRTAIEAGHFLLHYQPQMDGMTNMVGVEALLRWQHAERGLLLASEFISLAETTGIIQTLGGWVLAKACAQLADWAVQPHLAHLSVSVNVSAKQFHQTDFVDQVLRALNQQPGIDPTKLKLELTEYVMLDDIAGAIEKMAALKTRGVTLSLDDFGTGYSSLTYLKRLPLDQLKIDQSFVHDLLTDPADTAITNTIISLGHSLGLEVVAEGVETEAQRDFLRSHGCDGYQGFLFSKAVDAKELEAFARQ